MVVLTGGLNICILKKTLNPFEALTIFNKNAITALNIYFIHLVSDPVYLAPQLGSSEVGKVSQDC